MPALLKKYHDRENGFTLIELLIVVLIIGVLAAIAIPVYLGIQTNASKSAVRSDVNIEVKRVQVALTEGSTVTNVKANQANYTQTSVKGEKAYIAPSTTAGASADDFSISNVLNTSTTPAGPFNYSYTYDSVTGNFTDSNTGLAFGSATPSLTITTTAIANAVTGTAYSQTVNAATINPSSTTVWSATGLPTNWAINTSTGVISATAANVTTTGVYPITVTAVNGATNDTHSYNLNVYAVPTISTTTLPTGNVGDAYNQTINATAYPNTITYAVTSGTLPAGLTLDPSAGTITGTPTTSNTYPFTITATNTAGSTAKSYTVTINAKPAITSSSLPDAIVGTPYSYTVTATGSPAPTFTATNLPAGLNIDQNTGIISGTPTAPGIKTVNVTATNTASTVSANLPSTTSEWIYCAQQGDYCNLPDNASHQIRYTGTHNGASIYGTYTNGVTCNDALGDPDYGYAKACYFLSTTHYTSPTSANGNAENTSDSFSYSENPTANWELFYGGTTSWDSTYKHTGNTSMKLVTGSNSQPNGPIYGAQKTTVPVGTKVSIVMWISGTNGATWNIGGRTDSYDGSNNITNLYQSINNQNITTTGAGNWQRVVVAYTTDSANSTNTRYLAQIINNNISGQTIYVDDISMYLNN